MSDQITRKQSYRWTSMSQTTYDGASWDDPAPSVSENEWGDDDNNANEIGAVQHPTQSYGESEVPDAHNAAETSENVQSHGINTDAGIPDTKDVPTAVLEDSKATENIRQEKSGHNKYLSARTHPHGRANISRISRTSVDQDLDNLMDQISRELQPQEPTNGTVEKTEATQEIIQQGKTEDYNMSVPTTGYFSRMIPSSSDIESRSLSHEEDEGVESRDDSNATSFQFEPPYLLHNSNANTSSSLSIPATIDSGSTGFETPTEVAASERRSVSTPVTLETLTPLSNRRAVSIPTPNSLSMSTISQRRISCKRPPPEPLSNTGQDYSTRGAGVANTGFSDGYDSTSLSYTNSAGYHDTELEQESETSSIPDIEEMESFRFNKQVSSGSLNDSTEESVVPSSEEELAQDGAGSENGLERETFETAGDHDVSVGHDSDRDATFVSSGLNDQRLENYEPEDGDITHEAQPEQTEAGDDNDNWGDKVLQANDDNGPKEVEKEQEPGSSRISVNLGRWKPDTAASRSNFLQETSKKAPPGYVIDENGNLVDLTPSSMKQRVVSEYSEMESGWNAFPAEDNGEEIETIRDTKTLYDNSTIYNVPGLITNTESLPPLPTNIIDSSVLDNEESPSSPLDKQYQLESSASVPSTPGTSLKKVSGTPTTLASTASTPTSAKPHTSILSEIDNADLGSITGGAKDIPNLDINKVISGKESHIVKLAQLENYYHELSQFDTGLQAWINYTLRSSSKDNTDFIFEEYKNSKHVREAYANAEDINKKNTVITTVATMNQNVNNLRKKVLAHTMKPKNLFQSIGRKKL